MRKVSIICYLGCCLLLFLCTDVHLLSVTPPKKPPQWDSWTFHQKIRWRGHNLDPRIPYATLIDKAEAKRIMQKEFKVATTFFITDNPSQIHMENLPKNFIMKANNASNRGLLVTDGFVIATKKRESDFEPITCSNTLLRLYAANWLRSPYSLNQEKQYALVKPKIFFEEYLQDISIEIELFCFNGRVRLIALLFSNGYTHHPEISYYDEHWNLCNTTHPWCPVRTEPIEKPHYMDKLITFAERITANIDHVRIDLFVNKEEIYFNEFTFTTGGGCQLDHLNNLLNGYWEFPDPKLQLTHPYLDNLSSF